MEKNLFKSKKLSIRKIPLARTGLGSFLEASTFQHRSWSRTMVVSALIVALIKIIVSLSLNFVFCKELRVSSQKRESIPTN